MDWPGPGLRLERPKAVWHRWTLPLPLARVRRLFPQGRVSAQRVTLAPPLARVVCRWHPGLYGLFNALPLLRTHVLAFIGKP